MTATFTIEPITHCTSTGGKLFIDGKFVGHIVSDRITCRASQTTITITPEGTVSSNSKKFNSAQQKKLQHLTKLYNLAKIKRDKVQMSNLSKAIADL